MVVKEEEDSRPQRDLLLGQAKLMLPGPIAIP
jgi:hypothetical protein